MQIINTEYYWTISTRNTLKPVLRGEFSDPLCCEEPNHDSQGFLNFNSKAHVHYYYVYYNSFFT